MNESGKENWEVCSPRVIDELVTCSHRESRRAMLKRVGLTSAGIFSILASGTLWWANRKPTREQMRKDMIIPMACKEVKRLLVAFHHSSLDDTSTRRVKYHLHDCKSCLRTYRNMFNKVRLDPLSCKYGGN